MLRVILPNLRHGENEWLLNQAVDSNHVAFGGKVRYRAMVAIVIPCLRDEA